MLVDQFTAAACLFAVTLVELRENGSVGIPESDGVTVDIQSLAMRSAQDPATGDAKSHNR